MPLEMKINRENISQSVPFDKCERLCKTETPEVLNNVTKRMMDHSMLAYSQKMQDISSSRKEGITLAKTERFNLGMTPSWLEQIPSSLTNANLTSAQNSVGRKWATLHKLRRPNDNSLQSISDSVWNYKDTTANSQSFSGQLRSVKPTVLRENRPRSRSVLDLVVRNYTDNQTLEPPQTRPCSEQGANETSSFNTNLKAHPGGFRGRGLSCPADVYMLDNPSLRGQTNILTLPDISDTAGEITNMEISSSVQIVPFPGITELQAVPVKLHSSPLIPPTTKKLPTDTKNRHGVQKTLVYKGINKEPAGSTKGSLRVSHANNAKNIPSTLAGTSKVDKEKSKMQKMSVHLSPTKFSKETPKKDILKDNVTKLKTKNKSGLLETKDSSVVHKSLQNGATNGTKKDISDNPNVRSNLKMGNVKMDTLTEGEHQIKVSSPSPIALENGSSSNGASEQANDDETQSNSSCTIKSVLKKQRTKNDKGEKRPKQPKKTVQFGPKMVKEVTKIIYPWNANQSSSDEDETTNDENSDDDDDDEDDEESMSDD